MQRHRHLNLLAAVSLALAAVCAAILVFSYLAPSTTQIVADPGRAVFLGAERGEVWLWTQQVNPTPVAGVAATLGTPFTVDVATTDGSGSVRRTWPRHVFTPTYGITSDAVLGTLHPANAPTPYRFTVTGRLLLLPWWPVPVAFAILPAVAYAIRRSRRPAAGHCPACDYDLTANVSGTCPECGAPVPITNVTHSIAT